jgi:hypothetical protein
MKRSPRIDLVALAEHLEAQGGVEHRALIAWICETGFKERAAKDALSILRFGGWVESVADLPDGRSRTHYLTEGGHTDLASDIGRAAIRGGPPEVFLLLGQGKAGT